MPKIHKSQMQLLVGQRTRVLLKDSRILVGKFRAFDIQLNVILVDCVEFKKRTTPNEYCELVDKRALKIVVVMHRNIASITLEGSVPDEDLCIRSPQQRYPMPGSARLSVLPEESSEAVPEPFEGSSDPPTKMMLPRHRTGVRGVPHGGCHGLRGMRGMARRGRH